MATSVDPVPKVASRPAQAVRGRWSPALRAVAPVAVAAWLTVGLISGYGYVHRYAVYRGFPPPATPPGTPIGTTKTVSFYSRALHTRTTYVVHLPAGYARAAATGRQFPVLYVLHDWALWRREMPRMLRVASRWFAHPARPRRALSAAARRALANRQRAFRRAATARERAVVRKLLRHGFTPAQARLFAHQPQLPQRLRREARRRHGRFAPPAHRRRHRSTPAVRS